MKINDKMIKLASEIYNLEREKEILDSKLKPLREELQGKITEYGTHQVGDHVVVKIHHPSTYVKGYDRKPYDTLQVK